VQPDQIQRDLLQHLESDVAQASILQKIENGLKHLAIIAQHCATTNHSAASLLASSLPSEAKLNPCGGSWPKVPHKFEMRNWKDGIPL
jgi:hypothetical protein